MNKIGIWRFESIYYENIFNDAKMAIKDKIKIFNRNQINLKIKHVVFLTWFTYVHSFYDLVWSILKVFQA